MTPAVTARVFGLAKSWLDTCSPISSLEDTRVTMMAVAVDRRSEGIWAAKPSPMARRVYCSAAAPTSKLCWAVPTISPPMMLMMVIKRPATASPRTNFEAPSIAP